MKPIFTCKICGEKIYQKHLVQYHTRKHNISHKDYYDKYLKLSNEGICPVCGKETNFLSIWKGYCEHCSTTCSSLDPKVQDKLHKTNFELYKTINGFNTKLTGIYKQEQPKKSLKESREELYQSFMQENNCIKREAVIEKYGWMWYWDKVVNLIFCKNKAFVKIEDIPKIETYIEETIHKNRSHKEMELLRFIQSIYSGTIKHDYKSVISPKEIDIYLPDLSLGIEYNGTRWHSMEMGTPKDYHLAKSLLCRDRGIRLIHIYEFEDFEEQKQLLKNLILGTDNYPKDDFNKNNLTNIIPKAEVIYKDNNYTIYGAGELVKNNPLSISLKLVEIKE